jgi:dTDP-4-amino-4,6-dideoxygalactose transaminase
MTTDLFSIPQANPLAGYLAHREAIDAAIKVALEGGRYIRGPQTIAFEHEFAEFLGVNFVVGVGSGTDALALSLRALGIGPGDAVATVSHTAVATVAAIEMVGAVPVLVDINEEDGLIDLAGLQKAILEPAGYRLKAVIPVHLYGRPANLLTLCTIAHESGLKVIEDCAQAHGASFAGRRVGAWGDLAAFSFYPTKNLGAFGDGGAVATSAPDLAERVRMLSEYGWHVRYVSEFPGVNSRLDELQASILKAKLGWLEDENERRREIAHLYSLGLSGLPGLILPDEKCSGHVYHQYVIRYPERNRLQAWLKERGIGTLIHYPVPVHLQPAYLGRIIIPASGLPITEQFCNEILSLPIYPQLNNEQVDRVVNVIRKFFEWIH